MEKKTVVVNFRLSAADKAAAGKRAASQGRTLSNYLAVLVRGDLQKKAKANGKDRQADGGGTMDRRGK